QRAVRALAALPRPTTTVRMSKGGARPLQRLVRRRRSIRRGALPSPCAAACLSPPGGRTPRGCGPPEAPPDRRPGLRGQGGEVLVQQRAEHRVGQGEHGLRLGQPYKALLGGERRDALLGGEVMSASPTGWP